MGIEKCLKNRFDTRPVLRHWGISGIILKVPIMVARIQLTVKCLLVVLSFIAAWVVSFYNLYDASVGNGSRLLYFTVSYCREIIVVLNVELPCLDWYDEHCCSLWIYYSNVCELMRFSYAYKRLWIRFIVLYVQIKDSLLTRYVRPSVCLPTCLSL